MTVFLDSSVMMAAACSPSGGSRLLFRLQAARQWRLLTSNYCVIEAECNLPRLNSGVALDDWANVLKPCLTLVGDRLVYDRPLIFTKTKDRPVLVTALAEQADYLLTLDLADFGHLVGTEVYGMKVRPPARFIADMRQREGF